MIIKSYDFLPAEAKKIREDVFVREQEFKEEFDDIDNNCTHLVMFDREIPVATARYFFDKSLNSYVIGRIAVIKAYRGRGMGAEILTAAEREIVKKGGSSAVLHAQCRAAGFYEKQGYRSFGEIEYEEYCPHYWMKKHLNFDK